MADEKNEPKKNATLTRGKPRKNINLPETEIPIKPLTLIELEKNSKRRTSQAAEELTKGFAFINSYPRSVTFFGSARFDEDHPYYKKARAIAKRISSKGFADSCVLMYGV